MKTTIIDLLNKIANGEEVPEKIKYQDEEYILNKICLEDNKTHIDYYLKGRELLLFEDIINIVLNLNDEVEILDEPNEDKIENDKIENLPYYDYRDLNMETITQEDFFRRELQHIEQRLNDYHNKINEIISRMNKLKEK